jgi:sec-independent protein translocase protein TatB
VFFDLTPTKVLVLAVLAVIIFGPDQLPKVAAQAGRVLREVRRIADGATRDLREGLGPEFSDFEFTDLDPRNLVRKHLLEGFDDDSPQTALTPAATDFLVTGATPPFDPEAT